MRDGASIWARLGAQPADVREGSRGGGGWCQRVAGVADWRRREERRRVSAVAYHAGTATGSDGASYNLETDIRAYQGTYIASDGIQRFGKFALI